jgi:hypothetical protein
MYSSVDGWLHCQRDPDHMGLPAGVPRALISESDFSDPDRNDSGGVMVVQNIPKQYDFIYINQVSETLGQGRSLERGPRAATMLARKRS